MALNQSGEIVHKATFERREEPRRTTVHSEILKLVETVGESGAVQIVVEEPPVVRSGATNAHALTALWREFGLVLAAVDFLALEFATVTPITWQSRFWKQRDRKTREMTSKQMAAEAAERIWPGHDWRPWNGSTAHDGLIDAALIACWGQQLVFGRVAQ